ncbi:MAG: YqeG family HAD IIIA-type phosphatase [Clostridia bacterium]|nr:YqeG family HAD IIIA-type phosphatase [Clostridia bacterium]
MSLYKYFYPEYSFKSVADIDVQKLKKNGIKLVLLDIDNTLVPYTSPDPDDNALSFLNSLKDNQIEFSFVSNNKKNRVERFNKNIGARYVYKAKKPLLYGINKMIKEHGVTKDETALIGDQIFTDIWGGRRAGVTTFLVQPIKEVDTLFFKFKRYYEKKVINSYDKYKSKSL